MKKKVFFSGGDLWQVPGPRLHHFWHSTEIRERRVPREVVALTWIFDCDCVKSEEGVKRRHLYLYCRTGKAG